MVVAILLTRCADAGIMVRQVHCRVPPDQWWWSGVLMVVLVLVAAVVVMVQ